MRLKIAIVLLLLVSGLAYAQIPDAKNVDSDDMLKKIGIQAVLLDAKDVYIAQLKQVIAANQAQIEELKKKCGAACQ